MVRSAEPSARVNAAAVWNGAYLPAEKIACPDGIRVANPAAKVIDNWKIWPLAMIPVAIIGLVLALRVWNARPKPRRTAVDPPRAAAS